MKQQQQQQQRQRQGAAPGVGTALAKALKQAKGRVGAPAVVAAALGELRRPQGENLGAGVLLLDVLDSVELVGIPRCSSSC